MINFANAKSIIIPEGEVSIIARSDEILWKKQTVKYKQELKFLESTGTQCINTGFNPKYNSRTVMSVSDVQKGSTLFGARNGTNSSSLEAYGVYVTSAGQLRSDYFGGNFNGTPDNLIAKTVVDKNGRVLKAFGCTITNENLKGEVNYPLLLMAVNSKGTHTGFASMRMYDCSIYDAGVLIRDYIPVLDWDDRPCMYDKVNDELFYNAGTGEFSYGK